MNHHNLKIWPVHFRNVGRGTKTFEIRNNDRAFQKGDTVTLKEFNAETKIVYHENFAGSDTREEVVIGFTGEELDFKIGDVYPIDADRVVFSLLPLDGPLEK